MSKPANFTIITKAYLPYARVLMERLGRFAPDSSSYVFLADETGGCFDPGNEMFNVIRLEEYVGPADLRLMAFQYNGFELCNALKAFAHRYIIRQTDHTHWAYYDSDIYPMSPLAPAFEECPGACILLTPHVLQVGAPAMIPLETFFLRWGIYNGGWMGIRRSADSEKFIEWFVSRLRTHSFDEYRNTFVDQLWLNLAPLLFEGVHIVRHAGANIGYWNLHERALTKNAAGEMEANGERALFFHFSGWDAANPAIVSKKGAQVAASPHWLEVANEYSRALFSAGLATAKSWPYSWGQYADGQKIEMAERRKFADEIYDGKWPADADPFNSQPRLRTPPGLGKTLRKKLGRFPGLRGAYRLIRG